MQLNITLSNKEKRFYFLYLLGMLLFAVLILSIIILRNTSSPFSQMDKHAILTLQDKTTFNEAQASLQKYMDSTFTKINKIDPEKMNPSDKNDIEIGIADISRFFKNTNTKDERAKAYSQIAKFYRMYYEDKKSYDGSKSNAKSFKSKFENCSNGIKDKNRQFQE